MELERDASRHAVVTGIVRAAIQYVANVVAVRPRKDCNKIVLGSGTAQMRAC